jgi:hypothetical protein
MSFRAKRRVSVGLALAWLAPRAALGESPRVAIDCPTWPPESVAQVETRVRTTLLTEPAATRVNVWCDPSAPRVQVSTPRGERESPIVARGGSREDDVLLALEQALLNHETPSRTEALPPAAVDDPAALPPAKPSSTAVVQKPAARAPQRVGERRVVEVQARLLLESWNGIWAEGVEAGLSVGGPSLSYGLVVGGRVGVNEPAGFELSEWSAAAQLHVRLPHALGLVGNLALGASLLAVAPAADLRSSTSPLVGAAFAELSVSRPFCGGSVCLAPAVGARFLGGKRRVNVNGKELATLPFAAPQASLSLIYRMD